MIYIYFKNVSNYFKYYYLHSYSFYHFQAVRIPQEYLNEDPNVNTLPLDRSFNEATIYNNYGKKHLHRYNNWEVASGGG